MSAAAADKLTKGGPLGVKKLDYTNFTDQFVKSFEKTPVPTTAPLTTTTNDHIYFTQFLPRSPPRGYIDNFLEEIDRIFVSDLYFPMVAVLRCHILHAWDQAALQPAPDVLDALSSLVYHNSDLVTDDNTKADMRCAMHWRGKEVTVLRFEYKDNHYALHTYAGGRHSLAGLISTWREGEADYTHQERGPGSQAAHKILSQLWNSCVKDSTPTVSQSTYGAYFIGVAQQDGRATIFLSQNLMKDFPGIDDKARSQPDLYRHLAYTFCWNLIYAINMKLEGLQLYPPGEEYKYLNALGRNVERRGRQQKQGFPKWGSWVSSWVYRLFGLQLPLIARKIRVSHAFEAFEIVGRESSYFTVDLFLDELVPGTAWSLVRFSRSLKLVLKTYDDVKLFQSEKSAYEKLGGSDFFPTLVAEVRGENSGDPGLLITYCGESVLEEDIQDDDSIRISEALKFMHARGVHHHDIHPRNLVREEGGHICVIDFGLAVPSIQCAQTQTLCEDKRWILGEV